jgi:hypothetical protein
MRDTYPGRADAGVIANPYLIPLAITEAEHLPGT